MKIIISDTLSLFLFVTILTTCSAGTEDLLSAPCKEASDCYVLDDVDQGLWLACSYDVEKCSCYNTIRSDFYLKWENDQCLMSKYGPCGSKGDLTVGCQDGFKCFNNQCVDPTDTKSVGITPFVFEDSNCSNGDCNFADNLYLSCRSNNCLCRKEYIADSRGTGWDIRNYDGDNVCSVGKFGPCGNKNGIKIDCHGNGISCVDGTCVDPNHLISDLGEDCERTENCKEGLLCESRVCIEKFSVAESQLCRGSDSCQRGLQCRSNGPWSSSFCTKVETDS